MQLFRVLKVILRFILFKKQLYLFNLNQQKHHLKKMRQLKLIWDFYGPDANKIAQHHEIHLKDFIKIEKLTINITGFEDLSNAHSIAFMVVNEPDMKPIRDALKPHRGQVYNG